MMRSFVAQHISVKVHSMFIITMEQFVMLQ